MKFWSRKSQSSKPNSTSAFIEPKFVEYKSCYHSNYGNSYSDLGPYGDPLPPHRDGLFHDSTSYGEEGFGFLDRYWNKNELNDQLYGKYGSYFAFENFQPPYGGSNGGESGGGGGDWVGEYETYLVGGWGEDIFSGGYGSLDEERGPYGDAKVEGELCWGDSYYSYDGGMEKDYSSYEDSFCWFGIWEDDGFNGLQENDNASLYDFKGLDEMRLCESIFGHWPCLEEGLA